MRAALYAIVALAACYRSNPDPGAGNVTCGDVDGDCPQGYACGCDGTCYLAVSSPRVLAALEPPVASAVWERGGNPEPREYATMLYDRDREVVLLFGGLKNRQFGDTWEWNGTRWTWRTDFGLSPRSDAATAYDEERQVTVVFSGYDSPSGIALLGTWEWDSTQWVSRTAQEPPPRYAGGMVYVPASKTSVLFGGSSASGSYADLWAWDGTTWTAQCTSPACASGAPTYRDYLGFTFDRLRSCALLFGGRNNLGRRNDLWCWDGTQWNALCTDATCLATLPAPRHGHAMVYDEARDRAVVFGGIVNNVGLRARDTWEWNGTGWVNACASTECTNASPTARSGHSMAYDAKRQRTLLFGGSFDSTGDLWQWDGTSWSILEPGGPTAQRDHAMAFDSARARTVMFDVTGRSWEWDGVRWSDVCKDACATASPTTRRSGALAYDAQRGETILFGGTDATNAPVQTTWAWNGTAWAPRCTTTECLATLPAARSHHAAAYDASHNVVVMFGGTTASGTSSETWTWNGAAWVDACATAPCTDSVPPARRDHAMTYDASRGVVVMFGGVDAAGVPLDDTWEWNGTVWSRRCTAAPCNLAMPAGRSDHVLVYDSRRRRTVLFSGEAADGARADAWEWDGTTWTVSAGEGPEQRVAGAAAYDAARQRIVVFGGENDVDLLADTWELHVRGESCTTGDTCSSGNCVDGVCCEETTCGTCKACNAGNLAGTCATITNMSDADTCGGNNTCNAAGMCGLSSGQPCTVDDECASLRCSADPCNRVCL